MNLRWAIGTIIGFAEYQIRISVLKKSKQGEDCEYTRYGCD